MSSAPDRDAGVSQDVRPVSMRLLVNLPDKVVVDEQATKVVAEAQNGSFGLTNDYLRIAQDLLGWRLETVAWLALLASLVVVPAALGLWRTVPHPLPPDSLEAHQ